MFLAEGRRQRDPLVRCQGHKFLIGFLMMVDHHLTELFHRITRALLRGYATEFNFQHAAHCSFHDELSVSRAQIGHAGLFAAGVGVCGRVRVVVLSCVCVAVCVAVAIAVLVGILLALDRDTSLSSDDPEATGNKHCYHPDVCRFDKLLAPHYIPSLWRRIYPPLLRLFLDVEEPNR